MNESRRIGGPSRANWKRAPWAWLVVCAAISLAFTPSFLQTLRPPRIPASQKSEGSSLEYYVLDFSQEWASARNLLEGFPIYTNQEDSLARLSGFRRDAKDPANPFFPSVNAHPPTSILLAVPIAWLEYPDAFMVWNLFSLALFGISIWLVARELHMTVSTSGLLVGWTLFLFCNPFRQQVNEGQLNMVLLTLITGAWVLDRSDRVGWAGALIGLAAAIKVFPGFMLVYYAVRGQWKAVLTGALALLGATGLTVLAVGKETYATYHRDVLPHIVMTYRDWWINASLPGLWSKLFDGRSGHVAPLVHNLGLVLAGSALCALILGLVLLAAIRRAKSRGEHDLTFALALIMMLLISPFTWDHYFLLLLVPVALLHVRWQRLGTWRWLYAISLAALWVPTKLVLENALPGPGEHQGQVATPLQVVCIISYQCYGLLGLFLVTACAVWRERRTIGKQPIPVGSTLLGKRMALARPSPAAATVPDGGPSESAP